MPEAEQNPLEQLAETVLFAPIGLVYEYKTVMPTLVRRGKSQVQIAKLMGTMAAREGQRQASKLGVDALIGEVVSTAATTVAKGITEVGVMMGLAPDDAADSPDASSTVIDVDEAAPAPAPEPPAPAAEPAAKAASKAKTASKANAPKASPASQKKKAPKKAASKKTAPKKAAPKKAAEPKATKSKPAESAGKPRLPIARYDDLTAREIIPLLDDLSSAQRATIRSHESDGRGRKTVLAKLDRLEG